MSDFSVHLFNRNFSEILTPMRLTYAPSRMSWAAMGGPSEATIKATGPEMELWELVERLRCPAEIYDFSGRRIWWGYVEKVSIASGQLQVSVSLEKMANRVCVTYVELNVAGVSGDRKTTSWIQDDDSVATYGRKEEKLSKSEATDEEADAYAATTLDRLKYPLPAHQMTSGNEISGELTCRGWYETLSWVYYEDTGGKVSYEESGSDMQSLGEASSHRKLAQSFQAPGGTTWQAQTLSVRMKREGSPTDNVVMSLCADSSGSPGAAIGSATLAGSEVSENTDWHQFELGSRVTLAPETHYWIVVERDGAVDGTNYYQLDTNEELGYANGVLKIYNGSSWGDRSPNADMLFQVGGVEENGAQVRKILDTAGQFLTGVDVDVNSGVYSSPYRDGDQSAKKCIEDLCDTGSSGAKRLLVTVDAQRRANVHEEPISGTQDYLLHANGELHDWLDRKLPKWDYPVGVWAKLANVIPASADIGRIADPSRIFLEEITYNVEMDSVTPRERDMATLLEM